MFRKSERGTVTVLVALALVILLGFAALTVDAGYLYLRKFQLQDTVDAIALAGGQDLPNTSGALATVKDYAAKNSLEITTSDAISTTNGVSISGGKKFAVLYAGRYPGEMDVIFDSENHKLKVGTSINFGLFFAQALDTPETSVATSALVAKVKLGAFGKGLLPIGVVDRDFVIGEVYDLSNGPGDGTKGNYQFVNLDTYLPPGDTSSINAGKDGFKDHLQDGYTGDTVFEVGGTVNTYTGESVGQTKPTINDRVNFCCSLHKKCKCGCTCGENDECKRVIDVCRRLVTVPLIEALTDATGVERVTIVGFAMFYLTAYSDDKVITGEFIKKIENGPATPGSSGYAIQTLKLIE